MKIANIKLKMNQLGSTITVVECTPAEAMLLAAMHHANAGGNPITVLEGTETEKDLKPMAVKQYLLSKYGPRKIDKLFPGMNPQLPETFEEAAMLGCSADNPTEYLIERDLAKE